ncbi:MAG: addiction module protein [Nitrospirota bacterium]
MTIKNIEKSILQLPPKERIHIVEHVLASLNTPDQKIEKLWVAESEKRYAAYKSGKIKPLSLQSIKKRFAR